MRETLQSIELDNDVLVQFIFMPPKYYKKVSKSRIDKESRYVSSDGFFDDRTLHLRYTVNENNLFEDIQNATDRSVECGFVRELLTPIVKSNREIFKTIINKLDELSNHEKQVGVFQIEINYLWNSLALRYHVDDEDYLWVRKRIAKILANLDIVPGEYYDKEANYIIRKAQKSLISDFESLLYLFNHFMAETRKTRFLRMAIVLFGNILLMRLMILL